MARSESNVSQWLRAAILNAIAKTAKTRTPRVSRPSPTVGALLLTCPGGRHAWYDSNVGTIRKPLQVAT